MKKVATHGHPTFGYDGPVAFVEVTRNTMSLSALDLGFSMEGDLAVLPMRYAAWIVGLGDARFLHPTASTDAALLRARGQLRAREQIEQASA
jgi:hypothetical protein